MNNSAELAVLLAIARVELRDDQKSALEELLSRPLDWDLLLVLAAHHGLEPLLFHHLHGLGAEIVSAGVMEQATEEGLDLGEEHTSVAKATAYLDGLIPGMNPRPTTPRTSFSAALKILRENCTVIAGRNMILASRLKEISAHLRARGVEHIAYRGPLLAEGYYGNLALRVFRDLDVMVRPAVVEAARDALGEIGFADKYGLTAAQQWASFRLGFEHPLTAQGGVDLDLHWRLVQRFKARALDMEGMWRRVTMAAFWGGEVPTFCAEDLAVSLCLHAGHHGWQQLSQMTDLAELFRVQPKLDWDVVRSHLGDSNTRRIVYVSMRLLKEHWEAEIPEDLMARIDGDPHVARLADRIQREIWPSPSPALTTSGLGWMLERSSGEDLADRLRLLAGSFFCPAVEDFEAFRLPPLLTPLYPMLRVMRLALKFVARRRVEGGG